MINEEMTNKYKKTQKKKSHPKNLPKQENMETE